MQRVWCGLKINDIGRDVQMLTFYYTVFKYVASKICYDLDLHLLVSGKIRKKERTLNWLVSSREQDAVWDGKLRPGAATWRSGWKVRIIFDSGPFTPLYNMTSSTKSELQCHPRRTGSDWATVIDNTYRKLVESWTLVFETGKHTNRQTNRLRNIQTCYCDS